MWEGFQGSISFALFHPTLPLVCVAESWQIRVYSLKTRLQVTEIASPGPHHSHRLDLWVRREEWWQEHSHLRWQWTILILGGSSMLCQVAGKSVSLATLGKANRLRLWDVELGLCR